MLVAMFDGREDLAEYSSRFLRRQPASRSDVVEEISVGAELSDYENIGFGLDALEELDDVGMAQGFQNSYFSQNLFFHVDCLHFLSIRHFYGYLVV